VQRPSGSSYNASNAGGGQDVTVDTLKPDAGGGAGGGVLTQSQMTTAYTKQLMENALSNLLAMQNRKFKYDAHSSPLYSIVQKQAEENARLASGRAYAQAKAATGGYGSSYATLAADEAGRQAMRELDDQQLALYEAARSEFEAENASALDWYNTTKQLYEDAYVLEQDAKSEAALAASGMTAGAVEASEYLKTTYGMEYSENAMRQDLLSKGYSEADVKAALESQRKMASGVVTDYKAGDITSAVAQAQTLDEAYRQGKMTVEEYDAAKAQNSKVIMDNVNKGMTRIDDVDYAALGFSDEEWGGMKDGEKKLAVFDSVGQMVKNGAVRESDYYKLLYNDIQEELASEDYQKSKNKTRDVVDIAIVIQDLYDNGYMSEDSYKDIVYNELMPNIEDDKTFKTIVYYARDYDSYGSDTKMAINLMDEQRIIPNIGKYKLSFFTYNPDRKMAVRVGSEDIDDPTDERVMTVLRGLGFN
jgi:RNA polymerase-interacting CarD/CdnL/TRCF family regulator